TYFAVLMVS
nr:Chain B, Adhesion G-protein coupled receptor G1 [Mus musculus]